MKLKSLREQKRKALRPRISHRRRSLRSRKEKRRRRGWTRAARQRMRRSSLLGKDARRLTTVAVRKRNPMPPSAIVQNHRRLEAMSHR